MKKWLVLILGLAAILPGCDNGGSSVTPPAPSVTVAISPASASIATSATLQFSATVANTSNSAVNWQVNGTTGGSATAGTISSSGLYTAPTLVPSPVTPGGASGQVTVTAVSQANPSASASAAVIITAAPSSFSISPSSATALAGATQQFTVNVTGSGPTPAVTWQVNTTTGGNTAVGTISTGGLYTAPANPPSGQKVTIAAVSQADLSMSASATVTVAPSVATLNGQYAFSFSGQNGLGFLAAAGSFQADGKGHVASGVEDVNSGAGIFTNVPFTGTYTVGPDGRGSLSLTLSPTSLGAQTFDMALTSNAHARLIRFDTFATGTGNLDLQDTSAFSNAALHGNFVTSLDGIDGSGLPLSSIGLLALDGAGNVPSGLLDTNDDGAVTLADAVSGSYAVASNGRGTVTFSDSVNTFDFAFYVVSAQQIRLVSLDSAPGWSGSASAQQGPGFATSSLHGEVVFATGGNDAAGNSVDDAGVFLASSAGLALDGTGDENDAGTVTSAYPFTGTFSIDATGHGSLTISSAALGNADFSFYLVSSSQGFLLGTDAAVVRSGTLIAQTQALFANSSLSGPFGFGVDGTASSVPVDKLGQFTAGGAGSASGTEDINGNGTLTSGLPLTANYSVASNGRGTLDVTAGGATRSLELYLISPGQMFLIGLDTDQVVLGQAELQFE